jgi:hypothetical protein
MQIVTDVFGGLQNLSVRMIMHKVEGQDLVRFFLNHKYGRGRGSGSNKVAMVSCNERGER